MYWEVASIPMLKDGMYFLPWQGSKIAGHCSCWRTLCFEEDVVQFLSDVAEAWVYWSFHTGIDENRAVLYRKIVIELVLCWRTLTNGKIVKNKWILSVYIELVLGFLWRRQRKALENKCMWMLHNAFMTCSIFLYNQPCYIGKIPIN